MWASVCVFLRVFLYTIQILYSRFTYTVCSSIDNRQSRTACSIIIPLYLMVVSMRKCHSLCKRVSVFPNTHSHTHKYFCDIKSFISHFFLLYCSLSFSLSSSFNKSSSGISNTKYHTTHLVYIPHKCCFLIGQFALFIRHDKWLFATKYHHQKLHSPTSANPPPIIRLHCAMIWYLQFEETHWND